MKFTIFPLCKQMADLEFEMERALNQMTDTSIRYERSLLVALKFERALEICDSFERVRACLPVQANDYDLSELGVGEETPDAR
jgi:hypothetical protein